MKIEVDLKMLLRLIEISAEARNENTRAGIPVPEVNKECYDAYIKGRKFGFTQGKDEVIREIKVATGLEEDC